MSMIWIKKNIFTTCITDYNQYDQDAVLLAGTDGVDGDNNNRGGKSDRPVQSHIHRGLERVVRRISLTDLCQCYLDVCSTSTKTSDEPYMIRSTAGTYTGIDATNIKTHCIEVLIAHTLKMMMMMVVVTARIKKN